MSLMQNNPLTLDFWQDQVTYGGKTVPTGSLACAALNITDRQIQLLAEWSQPLIAVVNMIGSQIVDLSAFDSAMDSLSKMISILESVAPFSMLDYSNQEAELAHIFSKTGIENAAAYIHAAAENGLAAALDTRYSHGVGLVKLIQTMAQLSGTLVIYKHTMTAFASLLHESTRTPDGYAAAFAAHFPQSLEEGLWGSMANATMQYVSAAMPGRSTPQLVKRVHYVSYVGLLRSDLYEGLSVGHAPRKCPICGRWFLTTDARATKYCGGLAPGDSRGRTCRQIGNLRGRLQRELAEDHPVKVIYTRRRDTINQYLHRNTLDQQTAAQMKHLAKNKMQRAISDPVYASGSYAAEMTQEALLKEVLMTK